MEHSTLKWISSGFSFTLLAKKKCFHKLSTFSHFTIFWLNKVLLENSLDSVIHVPRYLEYTFENKSTIFQSKHVPLLLNAIQRTLLYFSFFQLPFLIVVIAPNVEIVTETTFTQKGIQYLVFHLLDFSFFSPLFLVWYNKS